MKFDIQHMSEHTPGPWAIPKDDWWVYSKATGEMICQDIATEADCRLIAAAPDLYDAIRNSDDAHWTTAMRAAMAKVEGRT